MSLIQKFTAFFGRLFLSFIFLISGVDKLVSWEHTKDILVSVLDDWLLYVGGLHWAEPIFEQMLAYAPFLLGLAAAFEIVGGLLLLFGYRVRLGAFLLFLFLVPATIIFHHFWFLASEERDLQLAMFLKNVAILGGLLTVLAFGSQAKTQSSPPE